MSTPRRWHPVMLGCATSVLLLGACGGSGQSAPTSSAATSNTSAPTPASPEPAPSTPPPVPVTPSAAWQIPDQNRATGEQWGAYLGASSLLPGDALTVHISADGPVVVTPYRIGDYGGIGGAQVGPGASLTATRSPTAPQVDPAPLTTVAGWPETTRLDTAGWPAGFYLVQVAAEGTATNIPLVVRTADLTDKVVFIAGDLTWQAYNNWGGRSLYGGPGGFSYRSFGVSFDRPYSSEWEIWNEFDVPIVRTLEATGVPLGYTSVGAVAVDPASLLGSEGAISNGHDEYWTVSYRQALIAARDSGSDLAFLGANAGYWRVRLGPGPGGENRTVIGYKSAALDPLGGSAETTARFRDPPQPMPEVEVLGQMYDCYPSRGDATIIDPSFFLFSGTGTSAGSRIPGLIGIESDRAFARPDTPRPIQVPALSETLCEDGVSWSTMTYYTTGNGAGVFATGTMNWGPALAGADRGGLTPESTAFTGTVTANLAKAMAAGPMGTMHPARDDFGLIEQLPQQNFAD
ncbi:MAG: hypothetical protein KDC23_07005 [Actinobacteria bacterium]|nr:hypothetical protein [Actinomycetota bacterium]